MIKELTVHPKPKSNNAKIATLIFVLISAVGFIFYFQMEAYKGVVGVAALSALTTGILLYTKFVSPEFYYDITFDANEEPIFVVRQVVGKRQTTLSRIGLADISKVEKEVGEAYRKHKTPKYTRKYVYAPTMFPKEIYRLTVKNRYEEAEIVIECSDEFAALLKDYSKEAKANREAEGEE
jgi:hypothetical protein